jgi:MYXO-CTERM domain-containing protein
MVDPRESFGGLAVAAGLVLATGLRRRRSR